MKKLTPTQKINNTIEFIDKRIKTNFSIMADIALDFRHGEIPIETFNESIDEIFWDNVSLEKIKEILRGDSNG